MKLNNLYNTVFINIIGSPCSGKSTTAADLFAYIKCKNKDVELITEFAKDCVWDESYNILHDLIYMFGKQYHRLKRLEGKVEYAISDSPFLLSVIYSNVDSNYFEKFIAEQYKKFNQKTYVLKRKTPYINNGRIHTEEQSKEIDKQIISLLDKYNIPYVIVDNIKAVNYIAQDLNI